MKISNWIRDEENNVDYNVLAYCSLTNEQVIFFVREYLRGLKKSKRPKNKTVTIATIYGHNF